MAVAQAKHGAQVRQCALHVGVDVVPVVLARLAGHAGLPDRGAVLPELPQADVEAGTQAQIGTGLALPAVAGVVAVEVVVEQERRTQPRGRSCMYACGTATSMRKSGMSKDSVVPGIRSPRVTQADGDESR